MEDCSPQMRATATDDAATWSLRPHTITLRADGSHATLQLDDARQHRVTMASHSADHPPRDITPSPHRGVTLLHVLLLVVGPRMESSTESPVYCAVREVGEWR